MDRVSATECVELARELVQRPSITPDDAGCQALIAERLQAIGFHVEHLRFGEVDNLWAVDNEHTEPLFVFAGHTDVVPTGPASAWRYPPFSARLEDGYLHGRGAADMKASLAAMLVATERFLADRPRHRGSIGFLITSDEEGPARDGTVRVVETLAARGRRIDWCLVGEPSSVERLGDVIKNGRRGSLGAELRVIGRQGHIAYPHLADNPVQRALPALTELAATEWDRGNAHFPPTSFQISNIEAGTGAVNVIPGELRVLFNFRYSTAVTADDLKRRVERCLDRQGLDYEICWNHSGHPFLTESGPLIDACREAIREVSGLATELSTAGGTSDGRFIAPTGAQVVELGPLNRTIHQIDECVSVADLLQLCAIYQRLLERLLPAVP